MAAIDCVRRTDSRTAVCHVITRLDVGGAQETAVRTCAGLDNRFDVHLVAGADIGSGGSLVEEARDAGVHVTLMDELVGPIRPHRDVAAYRSLRRFFRSGGFSIVHTHSSKAGALGRLAAARVGVPTIVHTVHGWSFNDAQPVTVRAMYRTIERTLARRTDALVVVTSSDREAGLEARIGTPETYELIRSGIDLAGEPPNPIDVSRAREDLGIPTDVRVVGSVGRLSDQKDPLTLLRAFEIVHRERPDTHLLVVGDGPLRGPLERAITAAGFDGHVAVTGVRRDVPVLLQLMDVFVLTSRWEGLPRALIEAVVAGVPCVATDVAGIPEIVEDRISGRLVRPGDAEHVATVIVDVLAEPGAAAAYVQAARERVVAFGSEHMVADTVALYERLLSRR